MWRDQLLKPVGRFMERAAWQELWAFIEGLNHGNQSGKHRNKSSELNFFLLLPIFFFLLIVRSQPDTRAQRKSLMQYIWVSLPWQRAGWRMVKSGSKETNVKYPTWFTLLYFLRLFFFRAILSSLNIWEEYTEISYIHFPT